MKLITIFFSNKTNLMNNKMSILLILMLWFNISFSQTLIFENENFINLSENEVKLNIDNTLYTGTFQSFTSKKDKKEYLIYSYFSRTIIFSLDRPIGGVEGGVVDLNTVKLIYGNVVDSVINTVNKKGINRLENFVVIHESFGGEIQVCNERITPL